MVGNHQSHVDIPAVMGHLPLKMTVIAKKELFRIPFFGQAMRAFGILSIDRSNRRKSIETLNQAAAILKEQELSVLAFPEGTRSENGEISPFKKGPFMLAINSGIPILPVSIKGTYAILPKGQLWVNPGTVTLVIHPPVETAGVTGGAMRDQLIETVHQAICEGFYENA